MITTYQASCQVRVDAALEQVEQCRDGATEARTRLHRRSIDDPQAGVLGAADRQREAVGEVDRHDVHGAALELRETRHQLRMRAPEPPHDRVDQRREQGTREEGSCSAEQRRWWRWMLHLWLRVHTDARESSGIVWIAGCA